MVSRQADLDAIRRDRPPQVAGLQPFRRRFLACDLFHKPVLSAPVKDDRESAGKAMGEGYSLVATGMTFALTITGATLLGFWLDKRVGTIPLFTLIGTFGGMGLGGFWLWHKIRRSKASGGHGQQ
jgi:F0F1-type ATP synthase assembly protein I